MYTRSIWISLGAILFLIPWIPTFDMKIAQFFFPFQKDLLPHVFRWAPFLAIGVATGSLLLIPFFKQSWRPLLYLALTFFVATELITNIVLKDHFARPRPRQVEAFGGSLPYTPPWGIRWAWDNHARSFPSGHASTGFYFLALVPLGYFQRRRWLIALGWILGLGLGGGIGLLRMAQGGHFLSDIVAAAWIMWSMSLLFARFLLVPEQKSDCA